VYVGQTGRNFKTRYEEHISDIRFNRDKSKYASHILKENHEYGPIDKTMDVLKVTDKGKQLDVYERFYIYKEAKQKHVMNEQYIVESNVLFDLMI
jgi:hypothetical protein